MICLARRRPLKRCLRLLPTNVPASTLKHCAPLFVRSTHDIMIKGRSSHAKGRPARLNYFLAMIESTADFVCKTCGKHRAIVGKQCLICQAKRPVSLWSHAFRRLLAFLSGTHRHYLDKYCDVPPAREKRASRLKVGPGARVVRMTNTD